MSLGNVWNIHVCKVMSSANIVQIPYINSTSTKTNVSFFHFFKNKLITMAVILIVHLYLKVD